MSQPLADTIAWTTAYSVVNDLRPALTAAPSVEAFRDVFISIKAALETYLTLRQQDSALPQPSVN